jgi:hypothetical protein
MPRQYFAQNESRLNRLAKADFVRQEQSLFRGTEELQEGFELTSLKLSTACSQRSKACPATDVADAHTSGVLKKCFCRQTHHSKRSLRATSPILRLQGRSRAPGPELGCSGKAPIVITTADGSRGPNNSSALVALIATNNDLAVLEKRRQLSLLFPKRQINCTKTSTKRAV